MAVVGVETGGERGLTLWEVPLLPLLRNSVGGCIVPAPGRRAGVPSGSQGGRAFAVRCLCKLEGCQFFSSLAEQPNQFQYPLLSKPRRVEPGEHIHIFKVKAISLECQEVSGSKIQLGNEEKTPTIC